MMEDLYHNHHGGWGFESLIINKYHVKANNVADADDVGCCPLGRVL